LIFDIGANQGYKAGLFLRLGTRVVALEPDEDSARILEQKFLKYRFKKAPATVIAKAVSDENAVARLWIDEPGSAKNTLNQKWADALRHDDQRFGHKRSFAGYKDVETVTIDELIATYGVPLLIKIDVEGHELSVPRGMRQSVRYLSFEVNLPDFRDEGFQCLQVLADLDPTGRFNYTADCRHGLLLKRWLESREFSGVFGSCTDESIEVFWRCPARSRSADASARNRYTCLP